MRSLGSDIRDVLVGPSGNELGDRVLLVIFTESIEISLEFTEVGGQG